MVALVGLALFYLATYILSMILGISVFFFTPEGSETASQPIQGLQLLLIFTFSTFIPTPLNIGTIFLALWTVFCIAILVAWSGPAQTFHKTVKESLSSPLRNLSKNYLITFPIITTMLLVAEILLQSFQESVGIPTGSMDAPNPYMLLFNASYAAIFEEIGFRLIPIGAVVVPYIIWSGWKTLRTHPTPNQYRLTALAFLYPEGAKKRLKLRTVENAGWLRGISQAEWGIVLISATVFALAHILTGEGWGLGKLTITFMLGLVFGLVYLVYGIAAPILMHWFHNYYLTVLSLSYELFDPPLTILIEIIEISIVTVGTVSWAVLLAYLTLKSFNPKEGGGGEASAYPS